jgi:hypothetical protein
MFYRPEWHHIIPQREELRRDCSPRGFGIPALFHFFPISGPDGSQDYELLGGRYSSGTTTIMFRRLLFTNDGNDRPILPTTMEVIWCAPSSFQHIE